MALALDLTLRLKTDGAASLDDVMRLLWHRHGSCGKGVPEYGVESAAEEIAGTGLREFFDRAVRGTEDLPLRELLQEFGITVHLRAAESAKDSGGKPASKRAARPRATLGVRIAGEGEARLASVFDGGAAQLAGLAAGDVVVAVDSLKVSAANLESKIAQHGVGTNVRLHAFRRDELMTFDAVLQAAPADTCWLSLDGHVDDNQQARRSAWLRGGITE